MEGDPQMANMSSRSDESQEQRSSPEQTGLASKLSQGASEVTDQALERVQRTRDRLEDELTQRRSRLSERIRSVSEVLDSAGSKLGNDDLVADGLHYVSSKIDRVASYVESADPHRLADDLRDVARERPAWVFGGVFVLGLALGRFAKSSAEAIAEGDDEQQGGGRIGASRARATGAAQSTPPQGRLQTSSGGGVPGTRAGAAQASGMQAGGSPGSAGGVRDGTTTPGIGRPPVPPTNQGARQP